MGSTAMDLSSVKVVVIGGGLVGAMEAIFMAKRGFQVDLYESREDIRTLEHVSGRSINLALSIRGREALRLVGLEDQIVGGGIPMHARLIHGVSGRKSAQPYGKEGQFISSVDRRLLNETLLTEAEKYPNIRLHFYHKMVQADFDNGVIFFTDKDGSKVKACPDLTIGCDGAYSTTRRQMMRCGRIDFSQEYIPHGYMELCIPPKEGKFAAETNYLHIWPRDEFMMIALPNQDCSFTCTLFMPFVNFDEIEAAGGQAPVDFFRKYFPDAIPLIGEKAIRTTFEEGRALPMVSVKCSPYNYKDKVVILGDAAHAMVPFYGQGMNCGFEDCIVFNQFLDKFNNDFAKALPAYSEHRNPDAKAICDLAMYNYVEMRSLVNSRWFLFRKRVDKFLSWLMPSRYIPLYSMVTFSRIRYHTVIQRWKKQDMIVNKGLFYLLCLPVIIAGALTLKRFKPDVFSWLKFSGKT
ncbi:kynurenine 3-monooxygenase-like [Patiria miniata]|uniref:Kynurenine 3-monooxygenase n=1 Tax=Patiria miniata TaxID=46514 RepID=A0A913ZBL1_PATMI|nr:kynurenine 3-monooxygenase-like [Patiria miniata]